MPWLNFIEQWNIVPSAAAVGAVAGILPIFAVVSLVDMANLLGLVSQPKYVASRPGFVVALAVQMLAIVLFEVNLLAEMSDRTQRADDRIWMLAVVLVAVIALTAVVGFMRSALFRRLSGQQHTRQYIRPVTLVTTPAARAANHNRDRVLRVRRSSKRG